MTQNIESLTEDRVISAGHCPLSGTEIKALLLGNTIKGNYRGGFRFITFMGLDFKLEGRNHVGTHDFGVCAIDEEMNTLTVTWEKSWAHSTTRVYRIGHELNCFDVTSGQWLQSFTDFQVGRHTLDIQAEDWSVSHC